MDASKINKNKVKFCIAAALALMMVATDSKTTLLSGSRTVLFAITKPLLETSRLIHNARDYVLDLFEEREALRERNRAVIAENHKLRKRIIELEQEELRSRWLAELVEAQERVEHPVLSSKIVSVQLQPAAQKVVLDRGAEDRINVGQAVVDHRGVIGQITATTQSDSAATLITDPNHSLPVRIKRNGILAVANGIGKAHELQITGLRSDQDVQVGDVLITSGLGERFPVGYPVARISRVDSNPDVPFAEVSAEPLAQLDPSYEILIVWSPPQDESAGEIALQRAVEE